ncbi:MAG: hypothetical protein KJ964_07245 [Verrucomicrobia bacterium]|nr:hypothetical protein [Verrucomicrobiota bacterium]MBU1735451.1 hypothetical protein [Verrucomicrobiota bacterium]MBU1856846.1 hypothetical protein [Verrucomicrobiota bacterium]
MKINTQDIVLFHVGGSLGSYGPIDSIINTFPKKCVVFGFEAREEEKDKTINSILTSKGVRINLLNAFIGEEDGKSQEFYINKHPESSSAFPPNPEVLDEVISVPYVGIPTWRENTILERKLIFKTNSLRKIIAEYGVVPDVLSVDAQGSELGIFKGTGDYLKEINALVSEVEFYEIYLGQGLYGDQAALLHDAGFRLVEIFSSQYWHPLVSSGKGLLTVGEALWFKGVDSFMRTRADDPDFIIKGIKLAAIAYSFKRYSYAYQLLKRLISQRGEEVVGQCKEYGFDILLDMLVRLDKKSAKGFSNQCFVKAFFAKVINKIRSILLALLEIK